jgi:uncharacterized protein (TIGR02300 family)
VTKPELGTKRLCAGCNAKFYDLHKTPIVCPMCEAVFVPPKPAPARPTRRAVEPVPTPVPAAAAPKIEDADGEVAELEDTDETGTEKADDDDKAASGGVELLEQMDDED